MYTDFAHYYDIMMADVDYAAWAAGIITCLGRHGIRPGMRVCECACGTGSLTIPLKKAGYEMCGVDISGEMLQAAMEKSRKSGLMIPYVQQDMAKLRLPARQDAILSTCDGVNYLSPADLSAFFVSAFRQVRPGGILMFDVSTPYKLTKIVGSHTLNRIERDYCYIWENSLNKNHTVLGLRLTAFVKNASGTYIRFEEEQTQYIHSLDRLSEALADAGFSLLETLNSTFDGPCSDKDLRWHLIAKRPEEV